MKTPSTFLVRALLPAFLFALLVLNASAQNSFAKQYRDSTTSSGYLGVTQTHDCNIVSTGTTKQYKGYVSKFTPEGDVLWNKLLPNTKEIDDVVETPGGDLIVSGIQDGSINAAAVVIIKTDASGNFIAAKSFSQIAMPYYMKLLKTADKNYIGYFYCQTPTSTFQSHIVRFDSSLNVMWWRTFWDLTVVHSEQIFGIQQAADGNLFATSDIGLQKIDLNGNLLWTKRYLYIDSLHSLGAGINAAVNSTIYIPFNYGTAPAITAIDLNGNVMWSKDLNETGGATSVTNSQMLRTDDNHLGLLRTVTVNSVKKIELIKLDTLGNIIWSNNTTSNASMVNIAPSSDNGLITVGFWPFTFNHGAFLAKTKPAGTIDNLFTPVTVNVTPDANIFGTNVNTTLYDYLTTVLPWTGVITVVSETVSDVTLQDSLISTNGTFASCSVATGVQETSVANGVAVYPNPATDELIIQSNVNIESYKLYTLSGELVTLGVNKTGNVKLDISTLAPGIYFLQTNNGTKTQVQKVIKM